MLSTLPNTLRAWRALQTDFAVVAALVGLNVAARLLPHAPDFTPIAASALFAASVLRGRALSVVVPLAGMILADAWLGFYDLRIMTAVYGTLALPACAAWLSGRWRRPVMIVPVLLSSSLSFFLVTNFAVWAFSPMYAANAGGLLLVGMTPAADVETTFNTWYDKEHVPALAKVPGVLCARRYRSDAADRERQYLALYHMTGPDVARGDAWKKAADTEWTRRLRPHFRDLLTFRCHRYVRR